GAARGRLRRRVLRHDRRRPAPLRVPEVGERRARDPAQPDDLRHARPSGGDLRLLFRRAVRPAAGPVADRSVGQEAGGRADLRRDARRAPADPRGPRPRARERMAARVRGRSGITPAGHDHPGAAPHREAWPPPRHDPHVPVSGHRGRIRPGTGRALGLLRLRSGDAAPERRRRGGGGADVPRRQRRLRAAHREDVDPGLHRGAAHAGGGLPRACGLAALDRPRQRTRIRLGSTVVWVAHEGEPPASRFVTVAYTRAGRVHRLKARAVVLAGGSWTTKHIVRDLPAEHREAYAGFYRSPCLMANVAVRNWRFLYDMGISGGRWFEGLGNYMEVRKLATFGPQSATISPDSPVILTLKVLYSYPGEPIEAQGTRGRMEMLSTSFRDYERRIREQLTEMFARSGFDARRDVAGVILNRWGHAYVNPQPGFFFGTGGRPAPREVLRRAPFGRMAFANTDLVGAMDQRNCFLEAQRAVKQ